MLIKRLIKTKNGRILMSILWGLGLSALFKKVCKGRNCIVYSAHNPREIEKNIYKHNEKCYNFEELDKQNKRNDKQSHKNCALLNRAEPYFNMNPVKPTKTGKMKAMCSRNNNFSNRGQKLSLIVYSSKNIKDCVAIAFS